MAPFAPHLAEELWHRLDQPFSVHTQPWPEAAEVGVDNVEVVVQVNGKTRGVITVAKGTPDDALVAEARAQVPKVPETPRRTVVVPDRVVNFVT